MSFCGFSVHGVSALARDLINHKDPVTRVRLIRELGKEEARLTSTCGGNCLRVFYFPHELLQPFSIRELNIDMLPWLYQSEAWHLITVNRKIAILNEISPWVWQTAEKVESLNSIGDGLAFDNLDAYLGGIQEFNKTCTDKTAKIGVLLTAVLAPPRCIIEIPDKKTLSNNRIEYGFEDIYGLYCKICSTLGRKIVSRYAPIDGDPIVVAYELVNEPDYEWLPDEQRMENARDKSSQPLNKYITEQHRGGIPQYYPPAPYAAETEWGSFEEQTGNWEEPQKSSIGVLEYPWGPKFDWYVKAYGTLARHLSFALADEAKKTGQTVTIVSGGVTHVNLDYLIRLAKIVPDAFAFCDAIGIHPYHWPEADIYDTQFVGRQDFSDWCKQTPRDFALYYMKCFDFYKILTDLIRNKSDKFPSFSGKKIWITEIGNGTKLWG